MHSLGAKSNFDRFLLETCEIAARFDSGSIEEIDERRRRIENVDRMMPKKFTLFTCRNARDGGNRFGFSAKSRGDFRHDGNCRYTELDPVHALLAEHGVEILADHRELETFPVCPDDSLSRIDCYSRYDLERGCRCLVERF